MKLPKALLLLKAPGSLRIQLLGWLLIPLTLLLGLNAFFSNRVAIATADAAFNRLLMASADAIADQLTVQEGVLHVDLPYVALQLLESRLQERIFYRVIAPDGKTLTGYDDLPLPAQLSRNADESTLYTASYRGEGLHLVALRRAVYDAAAIQPAIVVVAETGESRDALSRQILLEGITRQGLMIVATGVLLWFGLGRGLRPLVCLRDSLLRRLPSDLSPVDAASVQTEVRPLIEALNQHTERINKLIASRQSFIADAAHQMRTPLAEMRTQIEYCLRQDRADLAQETLRDIRVGIDELARTIAQLLHLGRSDPDVLDASQNAIVNLGTLARDTALEFVSAARKKMLDLSFDEAAAGLMVWGNEALLRVMISNLIDNAVSYTEAGGMIAVRVLEHRRETVILEIEDDGPGIPPEERQNVFNRFYRGQRAQAPGSGLGLAIAKDIGASHHATIELETAASGRGLCVRVAFQAAELAAQAT